MTVIRWPIRVPAWAALWVALACREPASRTSRAVLDASGTITVETLDDLGKATGERVTLRGVAADAKLGAVILVQEEPIYATGVESWPASVRGRRVQATGILRRRKLAPDPVPRDHAIPQGAWGDSWVLDEPAYALDVGAR